MSVGVVEIDAAPAAPVVDLAVGARARAAAVLDPLRLDAAEDRVELRFADLEGVVVRLELAALVKVEGQVAVDLDRGEMRMRPVIREPEDAGEKLGRRDLVVRRDDRVVEDDSHCRLLARDGRTAG